MAKVKNMMKRPLCYDGADGEGVRFNSKQLKNIPDDEITDKMKKDAKDGMLVIEFNGSGSEDLTIEVE